MSRGGAWGGAFVAVDVETTGLDTDPEARVVELAAVLFENGQPTDRRVSTRINPGMPIPPEATTIHGITDADVANAPTFVEAWPRVVALYDTDHTNTLAYSAAFDRAFVRREVSLAGIARPPLGLRRPWIDPLVAIRHFDRYVKVDKTPGAKGRHTLLVTCARRNVELVKAHAAEDDAIAAGLLWVSMEREIRDMWTAAGSIVGWLRIQSALAEQQEKDWQDYQRRLIGQGLVAFFEALRALSLCEAA